MIVRARACVCSLLSRADPFPPLRPPLPVPARCALLSSVPLCAAPLVPPSVVVPLLAPRQSCRVEYDGGVIFAIYLQSIVVSAAGLFIVVQCAYVGASWLSLVVRALAAIVIAVAINSVHYAGMQAASYHATHLDASNIMAHLGQNVVVRAQRELRREALRVCDVRLERGRDGDGWRMERARADGCVADGRTDG